MTATQNRPAQLTFGRALAIERTKLKLSVHQVTDRCSVSAATVHAWERDEAVPDARTRMMLMTMIPALRPWTDTLREVSHTRPHERPVTTSLGAKLQEALHPAPPPVVTPAPTPPERFATFGAALKALRERENVPQRTVGELCGVDASAVGHWEVNRTVPVAENYEKLLKLFPALQDAPRPAVQDKPKPEGRHDHQPARLVPVPSTITPIRMAPPLPPAPPPRAVTASTAPDPAAVTRAATAYVAAANKLDECKAAAATAEQAYNSIKAAADAAERALTEAKTTAAAAQTHLDRALAELSKITGGV